MAESRGSVRVERGAKRIRVYLAGMLVADTTRPLLVWESPRYPTYYLPADDVRAVLTPTGDTDRSPSRGTAQIHDVEIGGALAQDAAAVYVDAQIDELAGHVRLTWNAMDAWYEEDEEVFFHARNPYTRIDALHSSRHVVVELDGVVLADSTSPVILYETGHPPRHYLPATDVRRELLVRSDRVTNCPYKGSTHYFHAQVGSRLEEDLAWSYPVPFAESQPIAGRICFPAERCDITIDGARIELASVQ